MQLDKVDATIGAAIERAQIDDLPINGRNWATLTSLAPGAIDNGPSDQRTIRFAGHGLDDNDFLFDGVDASGVLESGPEVNMSGWRFRWIRSRSSTCSPRISTPISGEG